MFKPKDLVLLPFIWNGKKALFGKRLAMIIYTENEEYATVYWLDQEVLCYLIDKENVTREHYVNGAENFKEIELAEGRTFEPGETQEIVKDISDTIMDFLEEEQEDLDPEALGGHVLVPRARPRGLVEHNMAQIPPQPHHARVNIHFDVFNEPVALPEIDYAGIEVRARADE